MKRIAAVLCMALVAVLAAGCDIFRGKDGIEGTWEVKVEEFAGGGASQGGGSLQFKEDAEVVFRDGTVIMRLTPDMPVLGRLIDFEAEGVYEKASAGAVDTLSLSIETMWLRVLGVRLISMGSGEGITDLLAYKVDGDEMRVVYRYDLLPGELRAQYESGAAVFPWEGNETVKVDVWTRK